MKSDYRAIALKLKSLGISVIPLKMDGSKLPKIKWAIYQKRIMTDFEIDKHFKKCGGIAGLTGEISRLYCLDFDLKYQLDTQDFWKDFMAKVPKALKRKMLINKTRNNGYHIWLRTTYEATSTHLSRRASTIPELLVKYKELLENPKQDPQRASEQLLRKPFETIIETRSRGSYAVLSHPEYTRYWGKTFGEFSIEEVQLLNEVAYSLDYCFIPMVKSTGSTKNFGIIRKYNENATPQATLQLLEDTGMFSYVETQRNGNIKVLRIGSKSVYSGRIYVNGVLHLFSGNSIFDLASKSSFSPFEVYMITKNLTKEQAVKELSGV